MRSSRQSQRNSRELGYECQEVQDEQVSDIGGSNVISGGPVTGAMNILLMGLEPLLLMGLGPLLLISSLLEMPFWT